MLSPKTMVRNWGRLEVENWKTGLGGISRVDWGSALESSSELGQSGLGGAGWLDLGRRSRLGHVVDKVVTGKG